ncbi:acyl-CoA thioesterase [Spongisporangium articulatum]|uniref:Acyl-CoA thioesterase n=1 Tax=Spongisporangium articulatum TaxID=3362603 RepID=A0ABW8ALK8_9ACTN
MDTIPDAADAQEAVKHILDVLTLTPDESEPDTFVASSYRPPWGRVFGGQVLAQSLLAAIRTAPEDRPVHSLHGYFLRPGDPDVPIVLQVDRLRDGRSFSARRTQALQNGKPILSMISSFQVPAEGLEHADEMPDVPGPDELPSLVDRFGHIEVPEVQHMLRTRPVDLRHVEGPLFIEPGPERVASQAVWMRTTAALPDDPVLHTAMLAFASDYSLLESVLRRHGLAWNSGLKTASLDHAMWFHRPARADEWLLYVQHSPTAQGGRGLAQGKLFTRDGTLVATTTQEGMMRPPR